MLIRICIMDTIIIKISDGYNRILAILMNRMIIRIIYILVNSI